MSTTPCPKCGHEIEIGEFPFCPHGFGSMTIVGDDIPGGVEIKHGLCNEDGTPRRYYSKSEIAAEAKRRGYRNQVEHVTAPGTDKNQHTQRFV